MKNVIKKHYLIIGGTSGTGLFVAKKLADEDNLVSVIGRKTVTQDVNLYLKYYLSDITDRENMSIVIANILKTSGKISHLVFFQRYRDSNDNWQGEIDTSLTATKNIIDMLENSFDQNEERSIVLISSVVSSLVAYEQPLSYHVAKAGINQMVRYYAVKLGHKGIRVNCISPATVIKVAAKEFYLNQNIKLHDAYKNIIPLGRMGTSTDIYGVVKFLCSGDSIYITGQNIIVDGGFSLLAHEGMVRKIVTAK